MVCWCIASPTRKIILKWFFSKQFLFVAIKFFMDMKQIFFQNGMLRLISICTLCLIELSSSISFLTFLYLMERMYPLNYVIIRKVSHPDIINLDIVASLFSDGSSFFTPRILEWNCLYPSLKRIWKLNSDENILSITRSLFNFFSSLILFTSYNIW